MPNFVFNHKISLTVATLFELSWSGFVIAQTTGSTATAPSVSAIPFPVPVQLVTKVQALGGRFTASGKERIAIQGNIQRANGVNAPVAVIYQIPRKFRYVEGSTVIAFDGATTASSVSALSAAQVGVLESLFEDSIDGLLLNIQRAGLVRHLMNRMRLDNGRADGYTGPYLDVFQFVLPLASLPNAPSRAKHFFFDSSTQFLDRVQYYGGPDGQVRIETGFQSWQAVNGTFVPSVISRSENGASQFTLSTTSVVVGPAQNDNAFTNP